VLAVGLGGAGDPQQLRLAVGQVLGCGDRGDGRLAARQRAGLVEQDDVDRAHPFQREPVLDEDALPGGQLGRDRDHERDREAKRVGAGDDEDGHGPLDRRARLAEQDPDDERDQARAGREVEQQGGRPVGEGLGAGLGGLRLRDQPLDAGEGGVLADGVDLHAYG
jgi:hypothetical protein